MAKKKGRRRKQSLFSKVTNVGLIALGLSRVLEIIFNNLGNPSAIPTLLVRGATFGLSSGGFSVDQGARFYGPPVAAITTGKVLQFLKRRFPVR